MGFNRHLILGIVLVMTIFAILGCTGKADRPKERQKVTKAQVKAFQNQKQQKKVDIYIPIKEQYATSRHSESLKTLLGYQGKIEPRCYSCMSGDYFLAPPEAKPDPATIKYSITCAVCHELTTAEFKLRLDPLETCTACHHNGGDIIPGKVVRHPQKEMFLGYGAIGVPITPDSKYRAGLTCIECHMPNEAHTFEGKTPAEAIKEHTESICVMCHADQSEEEFAKEVDRIQNQIKKKCERLENELNLTRRRMDELNKSGIDTFVTQQVYDIIYTNLSYIKADGSMGIHNFEYASKILEYTEKRSEELVKLLK